MRRRELLAAVGAGATLTSAGCGGLLGCRGVLFRLRLTPVDRERAATVAIRSLAGADAAVDAVRNATDGPVTVGDDVVGLLTDEREVVAADGRYYAVDLNRTGENATVRSERLADRAAAVRAASVPFDRDSLPAGAVDRLERAREERVEWCTRDAEQATYAPVVEPIARAAGLPDGEVYYRKSETVTAVVRFDGRRYRAELYADTAE